MRPVFSGVLKTLPMAEVIIAALKLLAGPWHPSPAWGTGLFWLHRFECRQHLTCHL